MSFGAHARWARCRSAHLSSWSRAVNARLQSNARGLASSSLRLCAEMKPPAGFVEQRIASTLVATKSPVGGAEVSELAESVKELAALIDEVIAESAGVSCSETLLDIHFSTRLTRHI
eukprot:TRINITY_DN6986_c0_g1_i1.p1 TRINITY_DN6986_c0_g1~~TRINITY_DN6986_c0_g1_i1.p1  ORF type:complete len:117 (+),score=7.78 TRINITY_DN6986_c0_g1_i1:101-451(+)